MMMETGSSGLTEAELSRILRGYPSTAEVRQMMEEELSHFAKQRLPQLLKTLTTTPQENELHTTEPKSASSPSATSAVKSSSTSNDGVVVGGEDGVEWAEMLKKSRMEAFVAALVETEVRRQVAAQLASTTTSTSTAISPHRPPLPPQPSQTCTPAPSSSSAPTKTSASTSTNSLDEGRRQREKILSAIADMEGQLESLQRTLRSVEQRHIEETQRRFQVLYTLCGDASTWKQPTTTTNTSSSGLPSTGCSDRAAGQAMWEDLCKKMDRREWLAAREMLLPCTCATRTTTTASAPPCSSSSSAQPPQSLASPTRAGRTSSSVAPCSPLEKHNTSSPCYDISLVETPPRMMMMMEQEETSSAPLPRRHVDFGSVSCSSSSMESVGHNIARSVAAAPSHSTAMKASAAAEHVAPTSSPLPSAPTAALCSIITRRSVSLLSVDEESLPRSPQQQQQPKDAVVLHRDSRTQQQQQRQRASPRTTAMWVPSPSSSNSPTTPTSVIVRPRVAPQRSSSEPTQPQQQQQQRLPESRRKDAGQLIAITQAPHAHSTTTRSNNGSNNTSSMSLGVDATNLPAGVLPPGLGLRGAVRINVVSGNLLAHRIGLCAGDVLLSANAGTMMIESCAQLRVVMQQLHAQHGRPTLEVFRPSAQAILTIPVLADG